MGSLQVKKDATTIGLLLSLWRSWPKGSIDISRIPRPRRGKRKTQLPDSKPVPKALQPLECPECGVAAIVRDKGNSMMGYGFCGHEYIFKMVKIHCAAGHKFDALDEEGSIHDPSIECKGAK